MNTRHSNFGLGYRLTSAAFKMGRFTVSELQKMTGAGENTIYSFIHRLENAAEGLLESAPIASLSPRLGAPRKQYRLTTAGANYLARLNFEKAAEFGESETEAKEAVGSTNASAQASQRTPAVHIYEQERALVIETELRGVTENEIQVEVEDNVLTICAALQASKGLRQTEIQLNEWRSSFALPASTDPEQIHAEYRSGVLIVTVRKPERSAVKEHHQSAAMAHAGRKLITGYGLQVHEKQKTRGI